MVFMLAINLITNVITNVTVNVIINCRDGTEGPGPMQKDCREISQ